ncbi:hypothetical protein J7K97_07210 [Candidatus Aerophobetes bacterium]|nr:hypothetical protein [Candidatus Aerophobetes bacterium]
MFSWVKFVVCSAGIIWCGYRLSYLGDIICEKTRITRTIMGFAILAIATSTPEFITSAASIVVVNLPDFAAGDLFGSIILNLGIIAVLDLVEGKGPLLLRVHTKQILYAGWTIIFLSIAIFSMLVRIFTAFSLSFLGLGWESFILLALLPIALFSIFNVEKATEGNKKQDISAHSTEKIYGHITLKSALFKFLFYLFVIIVLGIWLSQVGKEIVEVMGWSEVLVGTFFLAVVTSFPEFIVSLSALRFDVNMAVGNILGSNFFDVMIIPLCDGLLRGKVFLSVVKVENLFTIVLAIILLGVVIVGLISRSKRCFLRLGWDAIAMILILLTGGYFLIFLIK